MPLQNKQVAITVLLAIFCLAMTGVLVLEWLNPPSRDKSFGVTPQQPQEPLLDIDASAALEVPPLGHYSEIVERPLFLSSRRPVEEGSETVVEEEIIEEDLNLTLLGVLLTPERTMALLRMDDDGSMARLVLGETLEGWEFTSARPTSITLRKSDLVIDLPLVRNQIITNRTSPSARDDADRRAIRAKQIQEARERIQKLDTVRKTMSNRDSRSAPHKGD